MKKLLITLCLLMCLLLTGCGTIREAEPISDDGTSGHARAYLVVTVGDAVYEPIPLQGAGRYTVSRGDYVNVIEVTENSICMAQSSCDNQDCVYQGVVDLNNRKNRVLKNMIICLPNNVMLELYTYDELQEIMPDWAEGQ